MSSNRIILQWYVLLFSVLAMAQNKTEVYFGFNQDNPTIESITNLDNWIQANGNIQIKKLSGYCDSVDVNTYNTKLSERRIQSVLRILKDRQVNISNDIKLQPYGENFQQAAVQAENRKVVIEYTVLQLKESASNKATTISESTTVNSLIPNETINKIINSEPTLQKQFDKAKKGDHIRLQNINFKFNSELIMQDSEYILTELLQVLQENPKIKIDIQGHICCNPNPNDTQLSYRRAKYIFQWLLTNGINLNRLSYKGFGSSDPIYRIPEKTEQERVANRRVELLIVQK